MIRKIASWENMPGELVGRWLELRPLLLACFGEGMTLELVDHESVAVVSEALTPRKQEIFDSMGATYIHYSKRLIMTKNVAYGHTPEYGDFRPDIHEIGRAVWFLLLTDWQRWVARSVEEGWAQDFEEFWRVKTIRAPKRLEAVQRVLTQWTNMGRGTG